MRRIGRRTEAYSTTEVREAPSERWAERVWTETQVRARNWAKKHNGRCMGAIQWNALWERTRDEIYGERWACERARSYARMEVER